MIQSMTSFARSESQNELGQIIWEMRALNHRYLELSVRLPENFRCLEMTIRDKLNKQMQRGKVEASLNFSSLQTVQALQLNDDIVTKLLKTNEEIIKRNPSIKSLRVIDILNWPGVTQTPDLKSEAIHENILVLLDETIEKSLTHRIREGKTIEEFFLSKLSLMKEILKKLEVRIDTVQEQLRKKLWSRVEQLRIEVDINRMEQELVLLLQKVDVTEEIERLHTHIDEVLRSLKEGGMVGRRLDFLMQELNREANTLGAKSPDNEMSNFSVELKVLIDQMREQVQNVV